MSFGLKTIESSSKEISCCCWCCCGCCCSSDDCWICCCALFDWWCCCCWWWCEWRRDCGGLKLFVVIVFVVLMLLLLQENVLTLAGTNELNGNSMLAFVEVPSGLSNSMHSSWGICGRIWPKEKWIKMLEIFFFLFYYLEAISSMWISTSSTIAISATFWFNVARTPLTATC